MNTNNIEDKVKNLILKKWKNHGIFGQEIEG